MSTTEQITKPIPLMDMVAQYRSIQAEIDAAVRQVLEAGQFILGPNVGSLEKEVASYLGVGRGVGVASGTDALLLALRALGIGAGDEVIVPSYTFFATAGAVLLSGAKPICVDVEPAAYTINVDQIESAITTQTKAIIPVHLYGHPANMNGVMEVARKHGLKVVEDNAQAFAAEYEGKKTGSIGDVACLSFFPSKNLGGYGDGGMVVTNDDAIADRVKMLRAHGWRKKYFPEELGYNSRLDELQAAILRVKLRHIDNWTTQRRELAARYNKLLASSGLKLPSEAPGSSHCYHLYIIEVENRDRVQQKLKDDYNIPTAVYYPQALHRTAPLAGLGYRAEDFPISEAASQRTLSIPFYPEMTDDQARVVANAVLGAISS